ncbi:MAG: DUF4132 domain-containing protein [Myxococcota bacterium]
MRRFEFSDGKSNKFWEVDVAGAEVTVHFGRIGTAGQTKVKDLGDAAKAQAECDKLIRAKTKKGYAEVGVDTQTTAAPAAEPDAQPTPATPRAAEPKAPPTPAATRAAEPATPHPSAASEDELVLPPDIAAKILPCRGRSSAYQPPKGDARALFETARENVDLSAWRPEILKETIEPLVEAALSRLRGEATDDWEDPVVEGMLAWMVAEPSPKPLPRLRALFRYWTLTRGLAAATVAALESVTFDGRMGVVIARQTTATVTRGTPLQGWKVNRRVEAWLNPEQLAFLVEVRAALAAADDDAYLAASAAVEALIGQERPIIDLAGAFVCPTEAFAHDLAREWDAPHGEVLMTVTRRVEDVQRIAGHRVHISELPKGWIWTLVHNVGAALMPALVDELDYWDCHKDVPTAVGLLPTDEALATLFARIGNRQAKVALYSAALRFPRRAVRVLAPIGARAGKASMAAKSLLSTVVRKYPGIIAEVPDLPEAAARLVMRLDRPAEAIQTAPHDALPPVLQSPPWIGTRRSAKRTALKLPAIAVEAREVWVDGERERWARQEGWSGDTKFAELDAAAIETWTAQLLAGKGRAQYEIGNFLVHAPPAAARRLIDAPDVEWTGYLEDWLPPILARHGLSACPLLLRQMRQSPAAAWSHAAPIGDASLAPLAASALARKKSLRGHAGEWLERHAKLAAIALIPAALGKAGTAQSDAEAALRFLATKGHEADIHNAAAQHGEAAREAMVALLAVDPLLQLPKKIPMLPKWFDPAVLTAPRLRSGAGSLGTEAVTHVATMLAISTLEAPYAGLARVSDACDRDSVDTFVWELFEAWTTAGADSKQGWAFTAVGLLGGNESARRLTPLIRAWPTEGGFAKANTGLDVLAAIGTDVALMHLNGIASKVKSKPLQKRARDKIASVAKRLGLTADDLADRLVPDLGLDPSGSLRLDYGRREFTVGFDEHLRPFVRDADGKRLRDLPKPGKTDAAERAEPAHRQWKALKKDARAAAKLQVTRLESAMCQQRRWSAATFRDFFVGHPLLIHVVRRLVWGMFDDADTLLATFRVAEDRSLADADDEVFTLPSDSRVGIAHAVELPPEAGATWGELFADYEIIAPFQQLGREVYTIDDTELAKRELTRVQGAVVDTKRVLGLTGRGWSRGSVEDGGAFHTMERPLASGRTAALWLDPGIIVGMPDNDEDQTLGTVSLHGGPVGWDAKGSETFGVLGPAELSELIRDLESLRA